MKPTVEKAPTGAVYSLFFILTAAVAVSEWGCYLRTMLKGAGHLAWLEPC